MSTAIFRQISLYCISDITPSCHGPSSIYQTPSASNTGLPEFLRIMICRDKTNSALPRLACGVRNHDSCTKSFNFWGNIIIVDIRVIFFHNTFQGGTNACNTRRQ